MPGAGGITFLKTQNLDAMSDFCRGSLQMKLWLDQGRCRIFFRDHWLLGFIHSHQPADTSGIFTLFLPNRQAVDAEFERLQAIADGPPRVNEEFRIYQFFIRDPERRCFEIQSFEHPIDWSF